MHPPALRNAGIFVNKYLDPEMPLKVLDVGSFNVNGTLRPLFTWRGAYCDYCGNVETILGDQPPKCEQWDCYASKPLQFGKCCDGEGTVDSPVTKVGKEWKYFGLETRSACNPYGDLSDPQKKRYNVDLISDDPHVFPLETDAFDVIISSSCFEHDTLFWLTFAEMARVTKDGGLIYLNTPSSGPYHGYPHDCWRFYKDSYYALSQWEPRAVLVEQYIDISSGSWMDNIGIFRVRK